MLSWLRQQFKRGSVGKSDSSGSSQEEVVPVVATDSTAGNTSEDDASALALLDNLPSANPLEQHVAIVGSMPEATGANGYKEPGLYPKWHPSQIGNSYSHALDVYREKHSILVTPNHSIYLLMHRFDREEWAEFTKQHPQYTKIGKPYKKGRVPQAGIDAETDEFKLIGGKGNQAVFRIARKIEGPDDKNAYQLGAYLGIKKTRIDEEEIKKANDQAAERKNQERKVAIAKNEVEFCLNTLKESPQLDSVIIKTYDAIVDIKNKKNSDAVYQFLEIGDENAYQFAKRVASMPNREEQILNVANQLLVAMAGLHNNGIYHGDLKLDNIFFVDGKLKLSDFGAAKKPPVIVSDLFGINYAPPEYYFSHVSLSYEEFDSWATGLALLELCAGKSVMEDIFSVAKNHGVDFREEIKPVHHIWNVMSGMREKPLTIEQEKELALELPPEIDRSDEEKLRQVQHEKMSERAKEMIEDLKGKPVYQQMMTELMNTVDIPDALKPTISHLLDFDKNRRFKVTEALHLFRNHQSKENWLVENLHQDKEINHTKLLMTAALLTKVQESKDIDGAFYLNIKPQDITFNKKGKIKIAITAVSEADLLNFKLDNVSDYIYCSPEILFHNPENIEDLDFVESASAWSLGITLLKLYGVKLDELTEKIASFAEVFKTSKDFIDLITELRDQYNKMEDPEDPEYDPAYKEEIRKKILEIADAAEEVAPEIKQNAQQFPALMIDVLDKKMNDVPEPPASIIKSLLVYDPRQRATLSKAIEALEKARPALAKVEDVRKELKGIATHDMEVLLDAKSDVYVSPVYEHNEILNEIPASSGNYEYIVRNTDDSGIDKQLFPSSSKQASKDESLFEQENPATSSNAVVVEDNKKPELQTTKTEAETEVGKRSELQSRFQDLNNRVHSEAISTKEVQGSPIVDSGNVIQTGAEIKTPNEEAAELLMDISQALSQTVTLLDSLMSIMERPAMQNAYTHFGSQSSALFHEPKQTHSQQSTYDHPSSTYK